MIHKSMSLIPKKIEHLKMTSLKIEGSVIAWNSHGLPTSRRHSCPPPFIRNRATAATTRRLVSNAGGGVLGAKR